jgi:hypothetical protein
LVKKTLWEISNAILFIIYISKAGGLK